MNLTLWIVCVVMGALVLAHVNASGWGWLCACVLALVAAAAFHVMPFGVVILLAAVFAFFAVPLLLPPLRRTLVAEPV
ncbi:MAG TPA: hypothetical protein VIL19_11695, partial [Casimicrobiaceae bacterium]